MIASRLSIHRFRGFRRARVARTRSLGPRLFTWGNQKGRGPCKPGRYPLRANVILRGPAFFAGPKGLQLLSLRVRSQVNQ
jgi:hypothetical protein